MTAASAVPPAPAYSESGLAFACGGETLVGVVAGPAAGAAPAAGVAVLIVVGGPQYRAGSHRQFTQLARALAARGCWSLRFDARGMGDSSGDPRSFEDLSDDIAAGVDALAAAAPAAAGIVLWGLCDGASAALLYLHERRDPRVAGVCLVNPWVRSEQTLAQTHVKHYYTRRLRDPQFWKKLARGGVGAAALRSFAGSLARVVARRRDVDDAGGGDFRARMATAFDRFDGPALVALSGDDFVAREFADHAAAHPLWQRQLARRSCQRADFAGADHTFSDPAANARLQIAVTDWLFSHPLATRPPAPCKDHP